MQLFDGGQVPPRTEIGKELHKIWYSIHKWVPPKTHRGVGHYAHIRALTEPEWEKVTSAIAKGYPATIVGHGWISGVALVVFEPFEPVYPGVDEEPTLIIQVPAVQLPGNDPDKLAHEQKINPSVERPTPGGAWDIFTGLCNTQANLDALKREGLSPPLPIGRYQY